MTPLLQLLLFVYAIVGGIFIIGLASYHKPESMPPLWQFGVAYVIWPVTIAAFVNMIIRSAREQIAKEKHVSHETPHD